MSAVGTPRAPEIPRRAFVAPAALALALLAAAVLDLKPAILLVATVTALSAWATHSFFLRWRVMVGSIVLCVMLVPITRYGLPVTLPFDFEPYRLLVVVVTLIWLAALLAESDTIRLEPSALRGPLTAVAFAIVVSVAVNLGAINDRGLTADVLMKLTFWASFLLVMLLLGSVLRTRDDVDRIVKLLVGSGAVVAFFTLVQNKTGFNIFDHLHQGFPLLRFRPEGVPEYLEARGSGFRVYASAQHPLALGAALVMLLPPGIYLGFRTRRRLWWACVGLIGIAALATIARTAVMMLVFEAVALLVLKPTVLRRIWWAVPPFLVAVNLAVPATLGTLKASFFPAGGLVAQQSSDPGGDASNRVADIAPGLAEAGRTPFFGQGWGTRVPETLDPAKTSRILDNQWLGMLLEAGWVGVVAWLWFFARNVRLLGGAALRDDSAHGWLLAGLAASILGFAVGMFTYDAFGFTQATLLMFILCGLGIAARRLGPLEE
jgi:hypothetical protein